MTLSVEVKSGLDLWWCWFRYWYGGAGEDILIDIEGGDSIFGDGSGDVTASDDTFVVGQGTGDGFDLSPDGTGLSGGRISLMILCLLVTLASLVATDLHLNEFMS